MVKVQKGHRATGPFFPRKKFYDPLGDPSLCNIFSF